MFHKPRFEILAFNETSGTWYTIHAVRTEEDAKEGMNGWTELQPNGIYRSIRGGHIYLIHDKKSEEE